MQLLLASPAEALRAFHDVSPRLPCFRAVGVRTGALRSHGVGRVPSASRTPRFACTGSRVAVPRACTLCVMPPRACACWCTCSHPCFPPPRLPSPGPIELQQAHAHSESRPPQRPSVCSHVSWRQVYPQKRLQRPAGAPPAAAHQREPSCCSFARMPPQSVTQLELPSRLRVRAVAASRRRPASVCSLRLPRRAGGSVARCRGRPAPTRCCMLHTAVLGWPRAPLPRVIGTGTTHCGCATTRAPPRGHPLTSPSPHLASPHLTPPHLPAPQLHRSAGSHPEAVVRVAAYCAPPWAPVLQSPLLWKWPRWKS